ncbi:MAG: hypothetical protein M1834_004006 [Cirrosporium novae-zelandiae]|nr:MAG: hypothetical protein M1834_004006 [Cirrosporium novae-zelandiae]
MMFEVPNYIDVEDEVKSILDSRINKNKQGRLEYLLRWKDEPSPEYSWEPADDLENADKMLERFHRKFPNKPKALLASVHVRTSQLYPLTASRRLAFPSTKRPLIINWLGEEYEIESIQDSRINAWFRVLEYLVKWSNFHSGWNSWEPQAIILAACSGFEWLHDFHKRNPQKPADQP